MINVRRVERVQHSTVIFSTEVPALNPGRTSKGPSVLWKNHAIPVLTLGKRRQESRKYAPVKSASCENYRGMLCKRGWVFQEQMRSPPQCGGLSSAPPTV